MLAPDLFWESDPGERPRSGRIDGINKSIGRSMVRHGATLGIVPERSDRLAAKSLVENPPALTFNHSKGILRANQHQSCAD